MMLSSAKVDKLALALKMITETRIKNVKQAKRLAKNALKITGEDK